IYRGADGSFELYEDEGDTYHYEQGAYSLISLKWNETQHTLSIGDRRGAYPGMPKERVFRIVAAGVNKGNGSDVTVQTDRVITYRGKKLVVSLPN
ncbi:MAG TPA: DUF5110 domain-containing protein, partial [Bacteroidota bacterium]|nr:DUF5110 domain-containing protein [Bacteroidota bacterium]